MTGINVCQLATEVWVNGGLAAYSTAAPTIVQTAYDREASASTLTATFGSAVTAGNLLVAILLGHGASGIGAPAGWGIASSQQGISNQFSAVFTKRAASGDTGITISNASAPNNLAVYEIASASLVYSTSGSCSGLGTTTTTTGSFVNRGSNFLRLVGLEWDNALGISGATSGYTEMSPATWNTSIASGNHAAAIYEAPNATSTGPLAVTTTSAAANYGPLFQVVDIQGVGGSGVSQPPQIVQTGYAAGSSSATFTAQLPTAPTVGNLMIAIAAGFDASISTPSGWTLEESQAGGTYSQVLIYARTVQTGDTGGVSFSQSSGNWVRYFILEIANGLTPAYSGGVQSVGSGLSTYFGSVPEETGNYLTVAVMTTDGTFNPTGVCQDWTLLSPTAWQNGNDGGNHNVLIYAVPGYYSGYPGVNLGTATDAYGGVSASVSIEVNVVTIGNLGPGGGGGPYPPGAGSQPFVAVMG